MSILSLHCVSSPSGNEPSTPLYCTHPVLHSSLPFLLSLLLQLPTLVTFLQDLPKVLLFLLLRLQVRFPWKATTSNYQMTTSALWLGKEHHYYAYVKKSYSMKHTNALLQPALYSISHKCSHIFHKFVIYTTFLCDVKTIHNAFISSSPNNSDPAKAECLFALIYSS